MKKIIHYLLIPIAFIFVPFFLWAGFNLFGFKITLKEFYGDLIEHIKSKESFGPFD